MRGNRVMLVAVSLVVSATTYVQGQPVPIWHNTLEDLASSTIDGGIIVNPPATFVPGFDGNAFAGNGSVYAAWDNNDVANIFDTVWNNSLGFTVDLYFSGDHWSTHAGDSGLWAVVKRYGGNDAFIIAQVRDGSLRLLFADAGGSQYKYHLTGTPLANGATYRLTMRQYNGAFEAYLDGNLVFSAIDLPAGYTCPFPPSYAGPPGGREMTVANRSSYFGGILQSGEWVDNVRVFNGYYTPDEIPVAEPGLPVAVATADVFSGFVPLTVQFDGSASYDTGGGTITTYEWDFDNNGTVDDSSGPIVSHQYGTAGDYVCKLTVTDNDNNTAVDLVPIKVNALPATGLVTITAMEPSGTLPAGSYPLTSVTTQRIGSVPTFTASDLVGPPDALHVEVTGEMNGSGAGAGTPADAIVGLELGSTVSGLNLDGEFLAGYFADYLLIQPDGTDAPEIFVIESSNTSDDFQIQLLTNGPGTTVEIAATVQVRSIDYASTSTIIGGTGRGGVGLDLDALEVPAVRGVRLTGADGFGGESGVDPVLIAAVPIRCNVPAVDADGDGDVDQLDFARFQVCFTTSNDPYGAFDFVNCYCFDRDRDEDVDEYDFNSFADCSTGPAILWNQEMTPDCQP